MNHNCDNCGRLGDTVQIVSLKLSRGWKFWEKYHVLRKFCNFGCLNESLERSKGYSGCGRCGGTWDWKEEQVINYSERRGMFPLCKECFKELSEEKILYYCKKLMKCWGTGSPDISKNWDKMVDNLKTDIHKLKKSYRLKK